MFEDYLKLFKEEKISQRQLCSYANKYKEDVKKLTPFLDGYQNIDIIERLYYIINDLHEVVICKYCNNKASWTGRLNEGYKEICSNKECRKKQLSDVHTGNTKISENRDNAFINEQNKVIFINDDIVKDIFKYDKYVNLVTNPIIIDYLKSRYEDSDSLLETIQRIRFGIEEKPKCPTCGKPVKWIGKKSKMFTTYCSDKCSANNEMTDKKKKATQLEHWGTENCYDSEKYKQHVKEIYGVEYHWLRPDIIEKRKATIKERYGVDYISQNEDIKQKIWNTTKEHNLCQTSKEEENLFNYLKTAFPDIIHHYKSDDYPFNCDFYIPSENLYIEYQGSLYHNGRSFLNSKEDKKDLEILKEKGEERYKVLGKKTKYDAIIETWTQRDVLKRIWAKNNNLKYLEIYRYDTVENVYKQIEIYLKMLHKEQLYKFDNLILFKAYEACKNLNINNLELYNLKYASMIIKHFQGNNFFKHEMELYVNDPIIRRKLIQNRCKYLNKKETDLTLDELLTGFKKSGIYYGYSHFRPEWTNWFINKYDVKTVYDPCGGWGHHLLGMLKCDKIIYNDLSLHTVDGVRNMVEYFNITNVEIHNEDARKYMPENVDAFFMCPPYYNLEKYECGEFADMEEYGNFLNDIFDIWKNNKASIFGIVIREDMLPLINEKPDEIFQLGRKEEMHFTKGQKKHKEIFAVFKK
ncbi:MAG: homing endonuclease [Wendovervirus sonii]|uniref:Homing endonuclease n=1 Tax=phage Lak_Megaphage_Sonny TaxID=3109229 RepID=A0ABZ0Z5W5_9CAUD|nr:MAG: homing endonuclease [phage Lak_Megaphage_Sonny]